MHKLKSGKKEHEFVSCMADLEVFIELKAHGVPDDAQKLLLEARDGLLRNKVRSPFWRAKAAAGFMAVMAKVRFAVLSYLRFSCAARARAWWRRRPFPPSRELALALAPTQPTIYPPRSAP